MDTVDGRHPAWFFSSVSINTYAYETTIISRDLGIQAHAVFYHQQHSSRSKVAPGPQGSEVRCYLSSFEANLDALWGLM